MYDCIIIGGGHNGLITAAYLAKAGKSVCVLERRNVLGGCASTEELWPGFKVSPAAYVISLLLPEIERDLKLKDYGFKVLRRDPSSITPTGDGKFLILGPDAKKNEESIAQFNFLDSKMYAGYEEMLTKIAEHVEPLAKQVPPLLPSTTRKLGKLEKIRNWVKGGIFAQSMTTQMRL
jgi:phytoene dehydrogenase-like protein